MKQLTVILLLFSACLLNASDIVKFDMPAKNITESLSLIAKPVTPHEVNILKIDGDRKLQYITDYHAVFTGVPFAVLAELLADFEHAEVVFPRVKRSIDYNPDRPLSERHRQENNTAFTFLGIGLRYHYIIDLNVEKYSADEFQLRSELHNSLDGRFDQFYGSWYLKKIEDGTGVEKVYVRAFFDILFSKVFLLQPFILRNSTDAEMKDMFIALYEEAKNKYETSGLP